MVKSGYFICLIFFLKGSTALAQKELVKIDYLSEFIGSSHLNVDSMWTYSPGDDSSNVSKAARLINTLYLSDSFGKPVVWKGLGWFRKTFVLPDSLIGKDVQMRMGQFGASEIYLDGRLVYRYGVIGHSKEEEHTYIPRKPLLVIMDTRPQHTLLVKFSNYSIGKPGDMDILKGFWLQLSPDVAKAEKKLFARYHYIVSFSIVFGFCLFFFFVFLFYLDRLSSLMAAFWLLDYFILFFSYHLLTQVTDGKTFLLLSQAWQFSILILNAFIVLYYYTLYQSRIPRKGWLILLIMTMLAVVNISNGKIINFFPVINLLFTIEFFRVIISGIRNRPGKGFWILGIGQLLSSILFLIIVANVFKIFPTYSPSTTREMASVFVDLIYPLMLSLQLAWEFGSSNRNLKQQLVIVKKLSDENMEKEKEKQLILTNQKEILEKEVTERTSNLNLSIKELKETQSQLIQSEKMASLGELTAGIAHEIQNPLNFVNNFSEVSTELVDEMNDEINKGNLEDAKQIAQDLKQNLEKINHHGKRAGDIVKGMLQHSRSSSGVKEPTNINALADEYLRLAYHGLRAKDKSFNATMKTDLDETIGNINVIPQDIGRVILNLITNAFYAVAEKKKQLPEGYEPTVTVSTKKENDNIFVSVKDNGNGIPQKVLDKIFQPFFTTKPTGQVTGLGLSLSYDIVKAHGGELKVETKEGEGSEFVISLPG